MKKIIIYSLVFISAAIFQSASAQTRGITTNIESQPKWGLAGHNYIEYLYLPDIDTYYYVPRKQFIYQVGGVWTFSSSLPVTSKRYDLFSANKVVINEAGAYRFNVKHKAKYISESKGLSKTQENNKSKNKELSNPEKKGG